MFVRNTSGAEVNLARFDMDTIGVGGIVVEVVYDLRADGRLERVEVPVERTGTDPPDIRQKLIWRGVSITAAGTAPGPKSGPHVMPVVLHVGDETRRLIVFGPRLWEKHGGALRPSPPAAFEAIALSFEKAFGGAFDLPPGVVPGTDLPHPRLKCVYQLNARGVGYYASEEDALGRDLPNIERPDQLIHAWNDRPVPAGFSPCPDLTALRLQESIARFPTNGADVQERAPERFAYLEHHAPPVLIFDEVKAGTAVSLEGLGDPVRFAVPPAATRVGLRRRRVDEDVEAMLMAVHVDADARRVRVVHAHRFTYPIDRAPDWVRVTPS